MNPRRLLVVIGAFGAVALGVLLVAAFLLRASFPVRVAGRSMEPALREGDRVFFSYLAAPLQRGDIVVYAHPENPETKLVGRVVGLGGETIEVRAGRTIVDGAPLDEPYVDPQRNGRDAPARCVVPEGSVFIMGDNRDGSTDSRALGPVEVDRVAGRYWFTYWHGRTS